MTHRAKNRGNKEIPLAILQCVTSLHPHSERLVPLYFAYKCSYAHVYMCRLALRLDHVLVISNYGYIMYAYNILMGRWLGMGMSVCVYDSQISISVYVQGLRGHTRNAIL